MRRLCGRPDLGDGTDRLRRTALLPVLMFTSVAVSIMTTLGAPLMPTIAHEQAVSLDGAQWMLNRDAADRCC